MLRLAPIRDADTPQSVRALLCFQVFHRYEKAFFFCEKKERFIRSVEAAEGAEGTDYAFAGEHLLLG